MEDATARELLKRIEALRAELEDVKIENRVLRQEVNGERTGWPKAPVAAADRSQNGKKLEVEFPADPSWKPVQLPPVPVVPPASPVPPISVSFQPERAGANGGNAPGAVEITIRCPVCAKANAVAAAECAECRYPLDKAGPRRPPSAAFGAAGQSAAAAIAGPGVSLPAPRPSAAYGAAGPALPSSRRSQPDEGGLLGRLLAVLAGLGEAARARGAERLVGEKLLNYVGTVLLVLGSAFFLKLSFSLTGAYGRLALGLAAGAALAAWGERLRRTPLYELFSLPVIGGGWILLYYTVFAAHYVDASRVISSPAVELALLCATAAGMILHALAAKSRLLTAFAFGAAYFVFAITHLGSPVLTVCLVLALAGAVLVRPVGGPELAAVNIAGFYVNYFPGFREVLAASQASGAAGPGFEFWYSLGALTAVHAAYAALTPAAGEGGGGELPGERSGEAKAAGAMDALMSLSAVLYAALAYSQVSAFDAPRPVSALFSVAAVLACLSVFRGRRTEGTWLSSLQGFLAAAVAALSALNLGSPLERVWAFALAAAGFGSLAACFGRRAFDFYGLFMAAAAGCLALFHAAGRPGLDAQAGLALMFVGAAGYLLSIWRPAGPAGGGLAGAWFYTGLAGVVAALWVWLEPAPFAVALMLLALALEWLAERLDAPPLFQQAALLELGAGAYSFLIDYGANPAVLGPLTSRAVTTLALAGGYAYLLFFVEPPEGSFLGVGHRGFRRAGAWLMVMAAAFGVYNEFGPRMRLPAWAMMSLALLALGRRRGPAAMDLRANAYLMTAAVAAEGALSYLAWPAALLGEVGWRESAIFAASSLALLAPLAWRPWAQDEAERAEELAAQHVFSHLSLVLMALFAAKEAAGVHITLSWTLLGVAYLGSGLLLRRKALRLPGLELLGLCVAKAFFMDLTGLALNYRVLSYMVLGGLLVASSYLYVGFAGRGDVDAS